MLTFFCLPAELPFGGYTHHARESLEDGISGWVVREMQALKCEREGLKSVRVEKKMAWMRAGDWMQAGAPSSPAGAVAWSGVHTAGAGERMTKGSSHTHGT